MFIVENIGYHETYPSLEEAEKEAKNRMGTLSSKMGIYELKGVVAIPEDLTKTYTDVKSLAKLSEPSSAKGQLVETDW